MPISRDWKHVQVIASKLIRVIHGQTSTFLIEDTEGVLHNVRSCGDPRSRNYLANQWLGCLLARSVGLPAADVTQILIPREFVDKHNCLRDQQNLRGRMIQPGIQCATRFLGDVSGSGRAFEHLNAADLNNVMNKSDFAGICLFEQWAGSLQTHRPIFLRSHGKREVHAFFVNHHLLFGGASWERLSADFHPEANEFISYGQASEQSMIRWAIKFQSKLPTALDAHITSIPSQWYSGNLENLRSMLMRRLDGFSALPKSSPAAATWSAPLSVLSLPSWRRL